MIAPIKVVAKQYSTILQIHMQKAYFSISIEIKELQIVLEIMNFGLCEQKITRKIS